MKKNTLIGTISSILQQETEDILSIIVITESGPKIIYQKYSDQDLGLIIDMITP